MPLGPVVAGHLLVIPRTHVRDFADDPAITGATWQRTATLARDLELQAANGLTSMGPEATQTVFHLHVHLVPRVWGDGLALPWDDGYTQAA